MGTFSVGPPGEALAYIRLSRGASFRRDVRPILGHSCSALMPYREAYIIHVACIMHKRARVRSALLRESLRSAAALNDSGTAAAASRTRLAMKPFLCIFPHICVHWGWHVVETKNKTPTLETFRQNCQLHENWF